MQVIKKYKADDGVEFLDANKCKEHEANCKLAKVIMSSLLVKPDSIDFSNGHGYIQHDRSEVLNTRNRFLEFIKRYTDHKWVQATIDGGTDVHPSYVDRMLGESVPTSIWKHWHRFSCIDSQFREWGQPFYANHPEGAKQIQLNREGE